MRLPGGWVLTVRDGPRVEHQRFRTRDETLTALDEAATAHAANASRDEVTFFRRRIDPSAQVAVRLEIRGPWRQGGVRGGVDLRGDGSAEAYTGHLQRSLIEQRRGESATAALRRVLSAD